MKKLIIDANLLLLYVIGSVDNGKYIDRSNRLSRYNKNDFDLLIRLIQPFNEIYITPYIATEVSNLIDLKGRVGEDVYAFYSLILNNLLLQIDSKFKEDSKSTFFKEYGITDASLTSLINEYFILTDDDPLCGILYGLKADNVLQFQVVKYLDKLI
ncbi:PIN domain-containing protein [Acinetobacter seifertii]|uniref:hypothetical protein n=1 Tax=Acinetobacter seifertii TaxID=1530123 RepID=UPI000C2276D1|nr:hypothetical protein [Acinetobacter seifertii]PJG66778.1 hypothetical protein CVD09_09690 [Acinetobacter seifertii]